MQTERKVPIPYHVPEYIILGHRLYEKWVNTPTNDREPIIGDAIAHFLSIAEMQIKARKVKGKKRV